MSTRKISYVFGRITNDCNHRIDENVNVSKNDNSDIDSDSKLYNIKKLPLFIIRTFFLSLLAIVVFIVLPIISICFPHFPSSFAY